MIDTTSTSLTFSFFMCTIGGGPRTQNTHYRLSFSKYCIAAVRWGIELRDKKQKKMLELLLELCVSSLRRGHANLLCIVPILTYARRREKCEICHIHSPTVRSTHHTFSKLCTVLYARFTRCNPHTKELFKHPYCTAYSTVIGRIPFLGGELNWNRS